MLVLTIRTDKPEAEIGLFENGVELAYEKWQAHRQLAETIHTKVEQLLSQNKKELKDLRGIAVFKGPGSFTGLRIGLTVGNALGYGLEIPIVSSGGRDWIKSGTRRLQDGENEQIAIPQYGGEVHTTKPRK